MEQEMKNGKNGNMAGAILTSGLIGLAAGATLALLLAPRSGKETRQMIGERARSLRESGMATGKMLSEKATSLKESGRETAEAISSRMKSFAGK